jgi:hypothetical protein
MEKLIKKWLNKGVQPTGWEKNTYTPKIAKTVYPNWEKGNNGKPILSPNGTGEFYGLIENK